MARDDIGKAAGGPQSVSVPGLSVTRFSIRDQIAADKYRRAVASTRRGGFPIRFSRICPPGAVGGRDLAGRLHDADLVTSF
jgi:hypothetical protein